eukprot:scaffold657_cov245-Pinguiococcus_pyrenoidosus.AAC.1
MAAKSAIRGRVDTRVEGVRRGAGRWRVEGVVRGLLRGRRGLREGPIREGVEAHVGQPAEMAVESALNLARQTWQEDPTRRTTGAVDWQDNDSRKADSADFRPS